MCQRLGHAHWEGSGKFMEQPPETQVYRLHEEGVGEGTKRETSLPFSSPNGTILTSLNPSRARYFLNTERYKYVLFGKFLLMHFLA